MTEIIHMDHELLLLLNGMHSPFFDHFMMACSSKWVWIPFYVSLVWMLVKAFGWRRAIVGLLVVAITITLCDQLSSSIIRPLVGRLRPANLANPLSSLVHIVDGYRGGRYGFPSSHAANTAGLTFFLIGVFRRKNVAWLMIVWMLLVCYSRVYLGVHYPGDLFVGGCIGAVVGWMMALLFNKLPISASLPFNDTTMQPLNHTTTPSFQLTMLTFLLTILALLLYAAVSL